MNAVKERRKKSQLNIALEAAKMRELIKNLSVLLDDNVVNTWSEAVAEAARIAASIQRENH